MTATTDYNSELIKIQNELKKYIFHHQMMRLNSKKSNESDVKTKLTLYENKIIQLCERQKVVTNNLRKERINPSNLDHHQKISKSSFLAHQQPVKSFLSQSQADKSISLNSSFNNKKLLIPVSAAAATSKKTNQQILVVPMPDGGARLAATSTNASRSTLTKSSFVTTSTKKNSNGYTCSSTNSLLYPANKTTQLNNFIITNTNKPITSTLSNNLGLKNVRTHLDKSINANSLLSNESVVKKKLESQQSLVEESKPIIALKPELKIDETKAKEQFFAKLGLVTKQALSEIQNKKSERKRRTTANPHFSNAAIEAKRISAQELAAKKANRKRQLAASNQDNLINNAGNNKRAFLSSNRGIGVKQDAKRTIPKVSNNKQLNQNEIKISSNCFVCDELCDSDLDEIMFCEDCHCLFHVTCSSTIDRIKKTMGVPCPKCERKRSLADDGFNDNSNESNVLKQKALDSSNSNSSSVGGRGNFRRKVENGKQMKGMKVSTKLDDRTDFKQQNKFKGSDSDSKLDEERYESLVRYHQLDRQVRDFRVKLALLKDKVCISKENRRDMLVKKENSKRAIESIVNLVKMIQKIENTEHKENHEQQNEIVVTEKMNDSDKTSVEPCDESMLKDENKSDQSAVISNEMVISNKLTTSATEKNRNETTNTISFDKAREAVDNLNALASLAVVELNDIKNQNSLPNQPQQENSKASHITTAITTTDQSEEETKSEQQPTNEIIELMDELQGEICDSIPTNSNGNEDEPPVKRQKMSPSTSTEQLEQLVDVIERTVESNEITSEFSISQDDEVSAAIASIQ